MIFCIVCDLYAGTEEWCPLYDRQSTLADKKKIYILGNFTHIIGLFLITLGREMALGHLDII